MEGGDIYVLFFQGPAPHKSSHESATHPDGGPDAAIAIDESVMKYEVSSDDEEIYEIEDQFFTREDHKETMTKDVPPEILYTRRGVRCRLCWKPFRHAKAVDMLLHHTKEKHAEKATASYLRMLRRENAFDKVIGKGILYCRCKFCKIFGLARLEKNKKTKC